MCEVKPKSTSDRYPVAMKKEGIFNSHLLEAVARVVIRCRNYFVQLLFIALHDYEKFLTSNTSQITVQIHVHAVVNVQLSLFQGHTCTCRQGVWTSKVAQAKQSFSFRIKYSTNCSYKKRFNEFY